VGHGNWWRAIAAIGSLLLATIAAGGAVAQSATPTYPVAPDPAECVVAPRPVAEIVAVMDRSAATPLVDRALASTPTPVATPVGEPADAETAAEVVATLHQLFACANAGDPLRAAHFFSDDFLPVFFGGLPRSDLIAFLSAPPQPFPEEQKRIIVRIEEVRLLPDGRAAVTIVLDEPDDPRTEEPDDVILEDVGGRWLVDEIHER
jgi:hypothetical protein